MFEAADTHQDVFWQAFPKTRAEFEQRFSTEEACRAFLIDCRWQGEPAAAARRSGPSGAARRASRRGRSSTALGSHDCFCAIFEVCVHCNGVSSADMQHILGFGSYGTVRHWTHKIRRAMVRKGRDKLHGSLLNASGGADRRRRSWRVDRVVAYQHSV